LLRLPSMGQVVTSVAFFGGDTVAFSTRYTYPQVPRTQFGSSGYLKTPRGLVLETYLRSKGQHEWVQHGIPKV